MSEPLPKVSEVSSSNTPNKTISIQSASDSDAMKKFMDELDRAGKSMNSEMLKVMSEFMQEDPPK